MTPPEVVTGVGIGAVVTLTVLARWAGWRLKRAAAPCRCGHTADQHHPTAGCLAGWALLFPEDVQGCPCRALKRDTNRHHPGLLR